MKLIWKIFVVGDAVLTVGMIWMFWNAYMAFTLMTGVQCQ